MLIPNEIHDLIANGALFVANHSGGKDSDAMLIRLTQIVPADQLIVVHASLGRLEWPQALEHAEAAACRYALHFMVARAGKTLFDMVERRFETRPSVPSWPSSQHRQCTSDLKRGPIEREVRHYAKANGFKTIVNCLGLRAEESPARSKKQVFRFNERPSNSVLTWFEWLPIHDYSTDRVFGTIEADGWHPHYAYALGNERLSCVFCIMGSRNDLKNGAQHHPELLAEYDALEKRTGYTMHTNRIPLVELVS